MDQPTQMLNKTADASDTASAVAPAPWWANWLASKHLNVSGLAVVAMKGAGILWPEFEPKASALADVAAGYFAGAALAKK